MRDPVTATSARHQVTFCREIGSLSYGAGVAGGGAACWSAMIWNTFQLAFAMSPMVGLE
jgi:hypothetical protein